MKTCLIVEDLPASQRFLTRALAAGFPGIAVAAAGTLREAREWLKVHDAPDLALIDLGLPDGAGAELIAELNRRAPSTMCIVASIYDDDEHLLPALRAGAQGYLLKDQRFAELVELLQGIISGRPPLSPSIARRLLGYFRAPPPLPLSREEALTQRETEVLSLIAKGMTMAESARSLGISPHTVSGHVKEIYRKLNVSCRAEAALTAHRLGLVR